MHASQPLLSRTPEYALSRQRVRKGARPGPPVSRTTHRTRISLRVLACAARPFCGSGNPCVGNVATCAKNGNPRGNTPQKTDCRAVRATCSRERIHNEVRSAVEVLLPRFSANVGLLWPD